MFVQKDLRGDRYRMYFFFIFFFFSHPSEIRIVCFVSQKMDRFQTSRRRHNRRKPRRISTLAADAIISSQWFRIVLFSLTKTIRKIYYICILVFVQYNIHVRYIPEKIVSHDNIECVAYSIARSDLPVRLERREDCDRITNAKRV